MTKYKDKDTRTLCVSFLLVLMILKKSNWEIITTLLGWFDQDTEYNDMLEFLVKGEISQFTQNTPSHCL